MGTAEVVDAVTDSERHEAFAIREAVFVGEQNVPLAQEFDGLDAAAEHLLARIDGRAVGTLRVRPIDRANAKIERVAVLADMRGRAVGAVLVRAAIESLRRHGFREAKLHAQTQALGFYAKLGFTAVGDVFDEDGIPHRAMRIDLTAEAPPTGDGS